MARRVEKTEYFQTQEAADAFEARIEASYGIGGFFNPYQLRVNTYEKDGLFVVSYSHWSSCD